MDIWDYIHGNKQKLYDTLQGFCDAYNSLKESGEAFTIEITLPILWMNHTYIHQRKYKSGITRIGIEDGYSTTGVQDIVEDIYQLISAGDIKELSFKVNTGGIAYTEAELLTHYLIFNKLP